MVILLSNKLPINKGIITCGEKTLKPKYGWVIPQITKKARMALEKGWE